MGQGLQRATVAAIETQIGGAEAGRIRDFVADVARHPSGVTSMGLGRRADRVEDRCRQKARKFGFVQYMKARWIVTEMGRLWLSRTEPTKP